MEIKIVEYSHDLAAAVAEMWNHSRQGWGGGNDITTEENVRQQEENSINLNTYLAMEGDQVVGYCGLSEYREDQGALYIALLNVRDDYHGKKIGKQLVLKAIERTIQLKWPRLDLYTWAGNTKAVPLYKKCGFFWEERDDTVHLMNFIPSVLSTEAVQDFFKVADWYQDSKRAIEVKPDGRIENGFHFYEYRWEKDGRSLRMEYERKGRGLRLIETDQYLIYASVAKQDLIFGSEYPIQFHILNKSEEPLHISIEGMDDQNIHFNFRQELLVTDSTTVEGRFFVGEITEEQSIWRTHPTVAARVKINGKEAIFRVGINSKFPARLTAKIEDDPAYLDVELKLFLELENHFDEEVHFSFRLPSDSFIRFGREEYHLDMSANERKMIPVSYRLSDYGFYGRDIEIEVKRKAGESIRCKQRIGLAFKGIGARLYGESEEYWHICNGLTHACLRKFDNRLFMGRSGYLEETPFYFYPKLGKPFSSEFSKRRPEKVEFYEENGAVALKALYQSQDYKDLQLYSIAKIYAEGLMEHYYEIHNLAEADTHKEVWLNDSIAYPLHKAILPYNGQFVQLKALTDSNLAYWDSGKIDENWIYINDPTLPGGICWTGEEKVQFQNWFIHFEHNLGVIASQGVVKTKPTYISLGALQSWQMFRSFALKKQKNEETALDSPVQFYHNDRNPFVTDQTEVCYKDLKLAQLDGKISLRLGDESIVHHLSSRTEGKNEARLPINSSEEPSLQLIRLDTDFNTGAREYRSLLVRIKEGPIHMEVREIEGLPNYQVDNGVIKLMAAPDFFPGLHSLRYYDHEWLDSSFPSLQPKSWWNPWAGGIRNALLKITSNSLLKERRSAEFVALPDCKGNPWRGIKISVHIEQHEAYKGLSFHQYYLLLPGVPILCHTTEIIQNTNRYLNNEIWYAQAAFAPVLPKEDFGWIKHGDSVHKKEIVYAGKVENEIEVEESILLGYDSRPERLQIVADYHAVRSDLYTNKDVLHHTVYSRLNLKHGERTFTIPVFYLLNEQSIDEEALADLKRIRFT